METIEQGIPDILVRFNPHLNNESDQKTDLIFELDKSGVNNDVNEVEDDVIDDVTFSDVTKIDKKTYAQVIDPLWCPQCFTEIQATRLR